MRFERVWRYRHILCSRRFAACLWGSRMNVLAASRGNPPVSGPYMAELDVTYRCDCRCMMCERWKDPRKEGLTLDEYRRLAGIFRELGVYQVSIAGGEPLLRRDIFPIIAGFAGYGMSVNVCTNGLLLEKYADQLCRSGASSVTVSLDGATADSHERIRGGQESFQKIENGIRHLAAFPSRSRPLVRVRMTLSNLNVEELRAYFHKWTPIVDHVLFQPVHHCRSAFYTGDDHEAFQLDAARLARQLHGLPLEREGYMKRLLTSLRESGTFPRHRCHAGVLMVRIDPWGNVYPCLEQHVSVGSLRDQDFRTVWNSAFFNQVRRQIADDGDCRCWYNNTALISEYAELLHLASVHGLLERLDRHAGNGVGVAT